MNNENSTIFSWCKFIFNFSLLEVYRLSLSITDLKELKIEILFYIILIFIFKAFIW